MTVPPEVLFHRNIRDKYPRGLADLSEPGTLKRFDLTPNELSVLALVRDSLNPALAEAKITELHHPSGHWHLDYIDADTPSAESFTGDHHAFIGLTIPLAKDVLRLAFQMRSSTDVWRGIGLEPTVTDAAAFQFVMAFVALLFIATHEYCHHVLGHQPDAISQRDPRTKSLRGNLQAQTREIAADGYAAMHLLEHVIRGGFRSLAVQMLNLTGVDELVQDRILFLCVLTAVAAPLYRHPPAVLDANNVYLLTHPPRAARLGTYMNHAFLWCDGFRPTLKGVIDGQAFANLMYVIGLAVCARPEHANSRFQNEFMRSTEGKEYQKQLFENLDLHKSLMGVRDVNATSADHPEASSDREP